MSPTRLEKFEGSSITPAMLTAAANLFSLNYGVWGPLAMEKMGSYVTHGARIKLSPTKLAHQILPNGAENIYIRMVLDDELVGNVFGTRWVSERETVLWITQLCVSSCHRNQGVAKRLLTAVHQDGDHSVGILSSHPFAIAAVMRVFSCGIENAELETTRGNARAVMDGCPVGYVRMAKLRGGLFADGDEDVVVDGGTVSCADTGFWVDHGEPDLALRVLRERGIEWPLGMLPDSHEFLVLVKAREKSHG